MTRIIDIDALMPADVELRWRGATWVLPGDLAVERVLPIQRAAQDLEDATKAGNEQAAISAFESLSGAIANVLAIRQPEQAQQLTFGMRELGLLAGAILRVMSGDPGLDQGNGQTVASS